MVSATQGDGSSLPNWLFFENSYGYFYGIPTAAGTLTIKVTATDGFGGTQPSSTFTLTINTPPSTTALADSTVAPGSAVNIAAGSSFTESDAGDTMTFSLASTNGATITWLSIDSSTGAITGNPTLTEVGLYGLRVTASDTNQGTASREFTLSINSVPVAGSISTQYASQDLAFVWTVPSSAVTDADTSQTLSWTAVLTGPADLPTWLTFEEGTATFKGTPASGDVTDLSVLLTATDPLGASASVTFTLSVVTNNLPAVRSGKQIPDYSIKGGAEFAI